MNRIFTLFTALATASLWAADLTCVGVLGNSGEQGDTLVRLSPPASRTRDDGLGLVLDRFGTLWDRGSPKHLNRYALDGRLLRSVPLPGRRIINTDTDTLIGDTLLLLLERELYLFNVADAASAPERVGLTLGGLARGSVGGKALCLQPDPQRGVFLFDPATRETTPLPESPVETSPQRVFVTLDGKPGIQDIRGGVLYVLERNEWQKVADFREGALYAEGDSYWSGQWHGTLKRFNASFAPAPGVVLGGASGSFIGHLEGNYEVDSPTSVAAISDRIFAIGGAGAIAHLASWDPATQKITLERRIGASNSINGHLALSKNGYVRTPVGYWNWEDRPDTPIRASKGYRGNGQVAVFENGSFFGGCFVYETSPASTWGNMTDEGGSTSERWAKDLAFPKKVRGCTVLSETKRRTLRLTDKGELIETRHDPIGKPLQDIAQGKLIATETLSAPTTLATLSDGRILAGADGAILELQRVGETGNWKEIRRTKTLGEIALGTRIYITAHAGRIWVADTDNHRILCTDETLGAPIATFGGEPGTDLQHCDTPTAISAAGDRAVVYDEGNQRILKLQLK